MGKLAIETRGLKKSFGKTHAVAGVDLAVSAGGVYGVLGPNEAGKTTTIRPTRPTPSPVPSPELPKPARSASHGGGSPRNSVLVDMLRR